jgi:hypothetical protein
VSLAGGAIDWLVHTGVLLHCARSDASALRHAAPGPPAPAAPSAGVSEGAEGVVGAEGPEGAGGPEGSLPSVAAGVPDPLDVPVPLDGFDVPDPPGVFAPPDRSEPADAPDAPDAPDGADGLEDGVDGPAVAGDVAPEVGSEAAPEPEASRAAESAPPSHAVTRSASTPQSAPANLTRPRRWRLPGVAIGWIPVLVCPWSDAGAWAGEYSDDRPARSPS